MKKKFKLITTIASLCLAVALMAFGVYAATTVNYNFTSSVQFTAEKNVKAKIEYSVATTNIKDEKAVNVAKTTVFNDTIGNNSEESAKEPTKTIEIGAIAWVSADVKDLAKDIVFTYSVYITSNAVARDAYKTLDLVATLPTADDQLEAKGYKIEVSQPSAKLVVGETMTTSYTITLTVKPSATIPVTELDSSITLKMSE